MLYLGSKMAQLVKTDNLNSIPKTHKIEGENNAFLCFPHLHCGKHASKHTHTLEKCNLKIKPLISALRRQRQVLCVRGQSGLHIEFLAAGQPELDRHCLKKQRSFYRILYLNLHQIPLRFRLSMVSKSDYP